MRPVSSVLVRPLGPDALDDVAALEARAHGAWTRDDVAVEFDRPDAVVLGARAEAGLAGFCVVRRIVDEAWILEIAVDPARRRRGFGRVLVEEAARVAASWNVASLWLEVRASNAAARALYAACGFVEQGVRRGYYRPVVDGAAREDAVLLARRVA